MRSFILCSTLVLVVSIQGFSQTEPIEGTIEYQRGEKRAAIVELPFPPEIVEGSLKQQFAKGGIKEQRLKGMQVFKNARLTPTDGEAADLYFKVEKKSRREDNVSIVHLIVGRPNENVALRTGDDAYRIQDAKSYLANLQPQAQSFELETNISKNDENIKKSEKRLNDYQEDRKKLDKKIKEQEQELNKLKSERESLLGKKGSGS